MSIDLKGRTALVTGASRGIGFAVALGLARAGANVAIVARSTGPLEDARQRLIAETGRRILAIIGDVADAGCALDAVSRAQETLGVVDILVNNAGGPPPKAFMDTTFSDWQGAIAQNLLSVIWFSQAVVPGMRARQWGRMVTIASTSAKEPIPGMVLSNATRAGVVAVAKTMSLELSRFGITVNTICPGPTHTERANALIEERTQREGLSREEVISRIVASVPVGRMARPEEVAAVIVFLASEQASYINGAVIPVDGGLTRSLY